MADRTKAQNERQDFRSLKSGRYEQFLPCDVCGKSTGKQYFSDPRCNDELRGFGVTLCTKCAPYVEKMSTEKCLEIYEGKTVAPWIVPNTFKDCAGYVASRRNEINGGWVVIYKADEQGLDSSVGKYVSVCEVHKTIANHETLALAKPTLKVPDFCNDCMRDSNG